MRLMRKKAFAISVIIVLTTMLTIGAGVSAATDLPYDGLMLIYDLNMPLLATPQLSSFAGTAKFTFTNVASESSDVQVVIDGKLTIGQESHEVKLSHSAISPIGVNTMLYLKPDCDPSGEKNVEIVGVPLQIDGGQIFFEGIFEYEGDLPVITPAGKFTTYRLRNQTTVSNLELETYLHYDKESKVMVYTEMKVRSSMLTYSYTMKLRETNMELSDEETLPSACLIATAAYGSPLNPQVQELREFRDNVVLESRLGSVFMHAFNAWYYSFSPSIAEAERKSGLLRAIVRTALSPLVELLKMSKHIYKMLPFNPEFSILLAGVGTSGMIGAFYLSPILILILYSKPQSRKISTKIIYSTSVILVSTFLIENFNQRIHHTLLSGLTSLTVISSLLIGAFGFAEIILWTGYRLKLIDEPPHCMLAR